VLSPGGADGLARGQDCARGHRPLAISARSAPLAPIEQVVAHANGLSVADSASVRSKSSETVKTQRRSVLCKLGARNMPHAVAIAMSRSSIQCRHAA
jgi:DNA-binding NarL/FixJ family response regulator